MGLHTKIGHPIYIGHEISVRCAIVATDFMVENGENGNAFDKVRTIILTRRLI